MWKLSAFFNYLVTSVPTSAEECECVVVDKELDLFFTILPKAKSTIYVSIQTSLMKLNAEHYGSVTEMDTTYQDNDHRMSLMSAVIEDGNGCSQVNAQRLVLTENVENISFLKVSCDFNS